MTGAGNQHAERVWFRLARLNARLGSAIADRLKTINLSVPQCDVLATLSEREGVNQQELAERLYVTKGNIFGLIDRLVVAGHVERRTTAGDRRSHAIFLTEQGRSLARKGVELQRGLIAETFGKLSTEQVIDFEQLIIKVRDHARALHARDAEK